MSIWGALSARLARIAMSGKTTTPIGMQPSIRALRLKGAALARLVQSGLKATCATLRFEAQVAAMRSAPLGDPPCNSIMLGCLAWNLSRRSQISRRSMVSPPEKATFGPGGISLSVSASFLAAMKSRLSIIKVVRWRCVPREPERGDQCITVALRKKSAAVSRNSSMRSRRWIRPDQWSLTSRT